MGTQDFPCTELTHQDLRAAQHRLAPATGQPASLQQEATWMQVAIPSLTNSTSAEQNAGLEAPVPESPLLPLLELPAQEAESGALGLLLYGPANATSLESPGDKGWARTGG